LSVIVHFIFFYFTMATTLRSIRSYSVPDLKALIDTPTTRNTVNKTDEQIEYTKNGVTIKFNLKTPAQVEKELDFGQKLHNAMTTISNRMFAIDSRRICLGEVPTPVVKIKTGITKFAGTTIRTCTHALNENTRPTRERLIKRVRAKSVKQRINAIGRWMSPYHLYCNWFNRSTRRVAKKQTKKRYKDLVRRKNENTTFYDDDAEDPINPIDEPVQLVDETEVDSPTIETAKAGKEPKSVVHPIKYARGERVREIAAAATILHGYLEFNPANREIIRRTISRHELLGGEGVRQRDKLLLINRANEEYWLLVKDDLVREWTISNKRNRKRFKQRAMAGW